MAQIQNGEKRAMGKYHYKVGKGEALRHYCMYQLHFDGEKYVDASGVGVKEWGPSFFIKVLRDSSLLYKEMSCILHCIIADSRIIILVVFIVSALLSFSRKHVLIMSPP